MEEPENKSKLEHKIGVDCKKTATRGDTQVEIRGHTRQGDSKTNYKKTVEEEFWDKTTPRNLKREEMEQPGYKAKLEHQLDVQMAWWDFLDKTTPNIEDQRKHTKWHEDTRGGTQKDEDSTYVLVHSKKTFAEEILDNTTQNFQHEDFLDKPTHNIANQGKQAKWHDTRGNSNKRSDNIFQGHDKHMNDKTSWFRHSTRNGKNQNRVFDPGGNSPFDSRATNSKDENRVFELHLRSLLSQMGFLQEHPTEIQADDEGAMQMATARRQMRHINMKQFVILQRSEEDLISFTDCPSALLVAVDSMKKQTQDAPDFTTTWMSSWDKEDRSFRPRTNVQSMFFLLLTIFVSFANKIVSSMAG
jgi:hypothetical protein